MRIRVDKELQELFRGNGVERVKGNEMKEFFGYVLFALFLALFLAPAIAGLAILLEKWWNKK